MHCRVLVRAEEGTVSNAPAQYLTQTWGSFFKTDSFISLPSLPPSLHSLFFPPIFEELMNTFFFNTRYYSKVGGTE